MIDPSYVYVVRNPAAVIRLETVVGNGYKGQVSCTLRTPEADLSRGEGASPFTTILGPGSLCIGSDALVMATAFEGPQGNPTPKPTLTCTVSEIVDDQVSNVESFMKVGDLPGTNGKSIIPMLISFASP